MLKDSLELWIDDIVNKYNNKYYSTDKMKPIDVKTGVFIYMHVENNDENPKFKLVILLRH